MRTGLFLISLGLVISFSMFPARSILAAAASPAPLNNEVIRGTVQSIILETDASTGIVTVTVNLLANNQSPQVVRLSQKTAEDLGLIALDDDAKPVINELALGELIEIDPATLLLDQVDRHPVANALAMLFSESIGVDYETIMAAHRRGLGFGVIAQALWLTRELAEGTQEDFHAILLAKETNVYTGFVLEDGTTPGNWAELRKAILDGKKVKKLSPVMTGPEYTGNGSYNGQLHENNRERDKDREKEKNNNGNNPDTD